MFIAGAVATITENKVEVELSFRPYPLRKMNFKVTGSHLKEYSFELPLNETQQVAQLACTQNKQDIITSIESNNKDGVLRVKLNLLNDQENVFTCKYHHYQAIENYPKTRSLDDPYKFLITTHICPRSESLDCSFKLSKSRITPISIYPAAQNQDTSKYHYHVDRVTEFAFVTFHFRTTEDPISFGKIRKVVSLNEDHLAVHMEVDDMKNTGASLNEEFDRNNFDGRGNYLTEFTMAIEDEASDFEYRDSTGLITTYDVKRHGKEVKAVLQPRYPLLGGWKTSYEINYNAPLLTSDVNSQKRIVIPMKVDLHGLSNMTEIEVVLPEGATITAIQYPKHNYITETRFEQSSFGTYYKRPVIQLVMDRVNPASLSDTIEIYYKEDSKAKTVKDIIIASFASSLIIIFLVYAKIINN